MATVSIITPAFNAAGTIRDTIRSIQAQTFKSWELAVIDDGSTDGTAEIAQSFHDARIKVFRQPRQGPGSARNRGISETDGKYVAFLDADDSWKPFKLAQQVAELERDETIGMIYSDAEVIREGSPVETVAFVDRSPHITSVYHKLLTECFVPCLTVVVRRAVLEDVGVFDPDVPVGQDWDLWIRVARQYELRYVPVSTAVHWFNPLGNSRDRDKKARGEWRVIRKHLLREEIPLDVQQHGLRLYFKRNGGKLEFVRVHFDSDNLPARSRSFGLWLWYREMSMSAIQRRALWTCVSYYLRAVAARPWAPENFITPLSYLLKARRTTGRRSEPQ